MLPIKQNVLQKSKEINATRVGSLVYHSLVTKEEHARRVPRAGWHAPLPEDFARHMDILVDMGANPITYDQLHDWHGGRIALPSGSLTIDFDNVHVSQYRDAYPILAERGWVANLMINTAGPCQKNDRDRQTMTWDEIRQLQADGWGMCSHTRSHKQMSDLIDQDASGVLIEEQMVNSITDIEKELGLTPAHFAYVGRGWNELAESIVMKHFHTARLWVANMTYILGAGRETPVGEILSADSTLESDGGPPLVSRYLTRQSNRYRIPGVDACNLPFTTEAMRAWVEGLFVPAMVTEES